MTILKTAATTAVAVGAASVWEAEDSGGFIWA